MNKLYTTSILSIILLAVSLIAFISCNDEPNKPSTGTSSISGILIDEQGTTVPGAILDVIGSGTNLTKNISDTTEEDGTFVLTNLPEDYSGLSIRITHPDFQLYSENLTDFKAKSSSPILLRHNDSCDGVVRIATFDRSDSSALSGVEIRLYRNGCLIRRDTTVNGSFIFENVCDGCYIARLFKQGYGLVYDSVCVSGSDTVSKHYYLTANHQDSCCHGMIRVTPLDSATHQPITGTEISLYKDNQLLNTYTYQQTPIYFSSLCPGTYYVHLSKSGYNGYGFSVTLTCNDTLILYKSMLQNHQDSCCHGMIRVTPLDSATHQPITGTEISLYKDNQLLNTYTYQQTPIYFTSLCPGTYYVHLSKSGYNGYGFSVTLTCNDTSIFYKSMLGTPHDTCCHGKIVVTVRNSTNGDLIDSVRVQISQNGNVLSYANTLHGVVSFTGLCPGTYNMYYMTKTGWTRTDSPTWDVTLSCNDSAGYVKHLVNNNHCCHGQITVNVLDSLTNNGIDSCYVGLSQNGSVIMTSYTSSGVSVFNGLCPGTYSLYYGKSGWYRPGIISWNVTINCNDTVSFTRKMIENSQCCSGSISGIVTDTATNAPIANARIVLYLNNTNMGTVYADSTGAFQFTGLCPGSYSLTLTANQYNSKGIHSISLGCSDVSNQLDIQMLHL